MQQIKAEIIINIPPEYVVISKVEYERLKKQELLGTWWSMKDLEQRLNKKSEWIKEHILYPQKYRKILDSEHGGPVYYPKKQGQHWSFNAFYMSDFLTKYFADIYSIEK